MFQLLEFDNPIPSCSIYGLKFNNGKWKFIYRVETPNILNKENKDEEYIIYEYISDLKVKHKKDVHPESVNIVFKTLDEYLSFLEAQRIADIEYREKWKKEHPDEIPNLFILENKNYDFNDLINLDIHFIAGIKQINENNTEFIGI